MKTINFCRGTCRACLAAGLAVFGATANAYGKHDTVVHSFTGGSDGGTPAASFVADSDGNLYSTALSGGSFGNGIVFRIAPNGTETVLHSFAGGVDGAAPHAGLVSDAQGNLYGTTESGGPANCGGGCGTVFEVLHGGGERVLHAFANSPDGANPIAALLMDGAGNLFGTTLGGGVESNFCGVGCGTVFELSPGHKNAWTESVIYSFKGSGNDATNSGSNLIEDNAGNLFGTATIGGDYSKCDSGGCGAVFELSPPGAGGWTERLLHVFEGGTDGSSPYAGLIADGAGNLYGATFEGGGGNKVCNFLSSGCGIVFRLAPDGEETILHTFTGAPKDGESPQASLFADGKGNLIGTTVEGGSSHNCFENEGCGTVFTLRK
ncbi:MAG TPA: choice-of-anchor tandem repeat GloVer-containing protein [Rhizomicrobium sp.]|jgi:uncharacterized repeat protein (TIGR03803 family)